jgi:hypothetical protein
MVEGNGLPQGGRQAGSEVGGGRRRGAVVPYVPGWQRVDEGEAGVHLDDHGVDDLA